MTQPSWLEQSAPPVDLRQPVVAPQAPGVPADPNAAWLEQQAVQGQQLIEQEQAAQAERDERRQRLEKNYSAAGAVATNFAKGLIDAVMAPAALGSAALEAGGALSGWKGLEDFGHDLGRSANAEELFATVGFLPEAASSLVSDVGLEQRKDALYGYDQVKKELQEQHDAWPMLSSVSHIAGFVAADLATGGLASAPSAAASIGSATVGGAAAGAQSAYQQNASLRDVLTSTAIGGILGGGVAGVAHGIGHTIHAKAAEKARLDEVFGRADDIALSAERAGGKENAEVIGAMEKELGKLRKTVEAFDNPTAKQAADASGRLKAAEALDKQAGHFDAPNWVNKPPTALQKVFRRGEVLDQVSTDVSGQAAKVQAARRALPEQLDPRKLAKLMGEEQVALPGFAKSAVDAPAAIGSLQSRVASAIKELPRHADPAIIGALRGAEARLAKAGLPEAMAQGHALSGALRSMAAQAPDDISRAYLSRVASALRQDLGSEAFGTAGQLYRAATAAPGKAATGLADQGLLRSALKNATSRGQLSAVVKRENEALVKALDAQEALTGLAAPKGMTPEMRRLELLAEKAEDAITLDGGPAGRPLAWFGKKAESMVENRLENAIGGAVGGLIGGYPGMAIGSIVGPFMVKGLGKVASGLKSAHLPKLSSRASRVLSGAEHAAEDATEKGLAQFAGKASEGTASEAARHKATGAYLEASKRPTDRGEQIEQYKERFTTLQRLAAQPDNDDVTEAVTAMARIAPGIEGPAAAEMAQKFGQLLEDMPKPGSSIRGPNWDSLSSSDVRLARAMWEATTEPMSVFDDFAAGDIDYDKVQYAWKQYPGLKTAAQAGLTDILFTQMSDEERAAIPEPLLTQLDNLFGMEGGVQDTVKPSFSSTVDMLAAQAAQQQPPPKKKPLELPTSKPTPTQRIAQGRA